MSLNPEGGNNIIQQDKGLIQLVQNMAMPQATVFTNSKILTT
jgi:hypothetical protein